MDCIQLGYHLEAVKGNLPQYSLNSGCPRLFTIIHPKNRRIQRNPSIFVAFHGFPRCAARCAQMTEGDREAINGIYRRPREFPTELHSLKLTNFSPKKWWFPIIRNLQTSRGLLKRGDVTLVSGRVVDLLMYIQTPTHNPQYLILHQRA